MFTGDEVESRVMLYWMQDEPQPTIEQHAKNMEKLLKHRKEFDYICAGHELVMADASLIEDYLEHDRRIMSGIEGEQMVMHSGGPVDFRMYQIEFKRSSVYKNTSLGYDLRYVYNNGCGSDLPVEIHESTTDKTLDVKIMRRRKSEK